MSNLKDKATELLSRLEPELKDQFIILINSIQEIQKGKCADTFKLQDIKTLDDRPAIHLDIAVMTVGNCNNVIDL